jgi:hypothetical protein
MTGPSVSGIVNISIAQNILLWAGTSSTYHQLIFYGRYYNSTFLNESPALTTIPHPAVAKDDHRNILDHRSSLTPARHLSDFAVLMLPFSRSRLRLCSCWRLLHPSRQTALCSSGGRVACAAASVHPAAGRFGWLYI